MSTQSLFASGLCALVLAGCGNKWSNIEGWGLGEVAQTVAGSDPIEGAHASGDDMDFRVFVPVGLERNRLSLAAQHGLAIGAGVSVIEIDRDAVSTVSALGPVTVGEQAQLGSIYSASKEGVLLKDGVNAAGFVRTAGSVRQVGTPKVAVGIMESGESAAEYFEWPVSFAGKSKGDQTSTSAQTLELRPGTYGNVVVEAGATAVLRAGQYFLESLTLREKGVLENNNTEGAVYVWIRRALILDGSMIQDSPASSVLFGYAGRESPRISGAFHGTLVAPLATVELVSTEQPHVGSFFASTINIADKAVVQHSAFNPNSSAGSAGFLGALELPDWLAP